MAPAAAPVVLLHGNPETAAVWDLLAPRLPQPPLRLSPPGFGAPLPDGFLPTVEGYRTWLIGALEGVGRPVHLVGHDWGGGHVVNVAMARPDLLVSWATDVIGVFDPEYEWHPLAQIWQREGDGERWVEEHLAKSPRERAGLMTARGADPDIALRIAEAFDATMGACILSLYRDAAQPAMAHLGEGLHGAASRPGLAVVAEHDVNVGTPEQHRRAADRGGARTTALPGLGHWWLLQDAGRAGAEALLQFWAEL